MNWYELSFRLREAAQMGFREFHAYNPPVILATSNLPRAVLQCLFFTLLGERVGGLSGRQFAFLGGVGMILTLMCTIQISDAVMVEKNFGTFYRLRSGHLRVFTIFALRVIPYVATAVITAALAVVVVAPLTGMAWLVGRMDVLLPFYLLMALTTASAGLAAAALAVGRRADILYGNVLAYLILLGSHVFIPPGRMPWLDVAGNVLPVRHGLDSLRAALAGRAWAGQLALEAAVGAGWLLLGCSVVSVQIARARRSGIDDFA